MDVHNNKELAAAITGLIEASGYKKGYIANELGIANQNLKKTLNKQNMSLDDANRILKIIGYEAEISIKKV